MNLNGQYNTSKIYTVPGHCPSDPFCPPKTFAGGPKEYVKLIESRMKDADWLRRIESYSWYAHNPNADPVFIHGPYMKEVAHFLDLLKKPQAA